MCVGVKDSTHADVIQKLVCQAAVCQCAKASLPHSDPSQPSSMYAFTQRLRKQGCQP